MSPKKQRIAIAEACGYFPMPWGWGKATDPNKPNAANKFTLDGLPDYLSDLNAMHEAEKVLLAKHLPYYASGIRDILSLELMKSESTRLAAVYEWHATPAQRAEAFLRTIGKWEDGE